MSYCCGIISLIANIMALNLKGPEDYAKELAAKSRSARLALNLSQAGLASRSGVSLASLKRFEATGLISLDSLLRLALVLNALEDFDKLFELASRERVTLDQLLLAETKRKRGRRK